MIIKLFGYELRIFIEKGGMGVLKHFPVTAFDKDNLLMQLPEIKRKPTFMDIVNRHMPQTDEIPLTTDEINKWSQVKPSKPGDEGLQKWLSEQKGPPDYTNELDAFKNLKEWQDI